MAPWFDLQKLLLGALIAASVTGVAYGFRLLTLGGAISAFVLGTLVFGLGGWSWSIILIVFFVSSSGLSFLFKQRKRSVEEKYAKGSKRDHGQVIANGGVACVFLLAHIFFPDSVLPWIGFSAALAAANADTWATELGVLSLRNPVLITTGKRVEPGTSGGISLAGTLASAAGALLIGLGAFLLWPSELNLINKTSRILFSLLIVLGGVFGSLVDSWLGAKVQAIYFCSSCSKETEKHPLHGCGTVTTRLRGAAWMNNDWVNGFCTLSGALLALGVSLILSI
jgi:uncharacterized protein (TIGR00297 family)